MHLKKRTAVSLHFFCLSVFTCKPRPAATLGVQTWPRKRPGATHTLDALWTWRSRAHPPDTSPLAFPVPRYRSSDHPNTPPPYRTSSMRIYLRELCFCLSVFIYTCAYTLSHATGLRLTARVLQLYPRHTDKQPREYPPPDSLSKSLCVDLEPQNLNSKLPCQSLPPQPSWLGLHHLLQACDWTGQPCDSWTRPTALHSTVFLL